MARRLQRESASSRRACLNRLSEYVVICQSKKSYLAAYEETLTAAPWTSCSCRICGDDGFEIGIFRGTERNKRRGFHNLYVFANRLARELRRSRRKELAVA